MLVPMKGVTAGTEELGPEARTGLLRRSFIFRDLQPDLLQRLGGLSHVRRLPRHVVLFHQGDEGDALFGVVEGLIRISMTEASGKELTLGLMEPGDVFGEIALLDGLPRTATAIAAEPSVLLGIERQHFLDLLEREGRLAKHIIELLCERVRENANRLQEYAFLGLGPRLARRINALAIAHGRDSGGSTRIEIKLSQSELAHMLGVSREAVNKQLREWARDQVLAFDKGYITVLAPRRLVELQRGD